MRIAAIQYHKQISPDVLDTEFKSSAIASLIDSFDYEHATSKLTVYTSTVIDSTQRAILDSIIDNHEGTAIPPEYRPTTNLPTYQGISSSTSGSVAMTAGYTDLLALVPSVPSGQYKVSTTLQYAVSSTSADFRLGARIDNVLLPSTETIMRAPRNGTGYRYRHTDIFVVNVISGVTKIALCAHSPFATLYYYSRALILERLS